MTLVEFLRARLDEDADAAKRVRQPYRLYACDDGCLEEPVRISDLYGPRDGEYEQWDGEDRLPNHHNSWALVYDPTRVLADVAAKRRIVDECAYWCEKTESGVDYPALADRFEVAMGVLRLLALPYADHPDYDEEWRP